MITLIIFILVLGLLVLVHELGHFLAARRFGVKVEEFGFGFPPRLAGVYRRADGKWRWIRGEKTVRENPSTIYSFNLIPLGGFVKIKGENGQDGDRDSFGAKKFWQRAVMLSAGVMMNIVLAAVIISIGLGVGLPQILDGVNPKAKVGWRQIQVVEVLPTSPAAAADVKIGDVIVNIDGREFKTFKEIQDFVGARQGRELTYSLKRGPETLDKKITPTLIKDTGRGGIGIGIAEVGLVRYPWYLAIAEGVKTTGAMLWLIISGLFGLLKQLLSGQNVSGEVAGPVGIATLTGQMVRLGWVYVAQFTAVLSLNLAVVNILPIPALDGGRLLFLAIAKLRRKPLRPEIEGLIHNIFFVLLLLLILFITVKDISKLGCLTCQLRQFFNL